MRWPWRRRRDEPAPETSAVEASDNERELVADGKDSEKVARSGSLRGSV